MNKKNLKILMTLKDDIINDSYIDLRVYNEAKSLIKNGYDVSIVCFNTKKGKKLLEFYDGIQILRFSNNYHSNFLIRFIQKKYKLFKIVNLIINISPDIIHVHDLDTLLEGVIAKIVTKNALIYDSHEDFPKYLKDDYPKFLSLKNDITKKFIGYIFYIRAVFLETILLFCVDKVITVNSVIAKKFENRCETSVIMNCKSINDISINKNINLRKNCGFSPSDFIVIYVGGIFQGRGYELLIDLSLLLDETIKILIIGEGELKTELEKRVNEKKINNVIFTGQISFEKVQNYVNISDVGIILFEPTSNNLVGSPNKLFDYMLGGIPIIASDFPVMKQIINENKCGILVSPLSKKEIMTAINYLRNHPWEKKQMGENARKAAIDKYNWETQEKELLRVYEELLES